MRVISLGYRTDLMVRRLAGSIIEDRPDHLIVRTPHIPAFWWGNFVLLGRPLRTGDAEWIRETCADTFPRSTHLAIGIDGMDGGVGAASEVAALGLDVSTGVVLMGNAFSLGNDADDWGIRSLASEGDWSQLAQLRDAWQGEPADDAERAFRRQRLAEQRELTQRGDAEWFGGFEDDVLVSALGIVSDGEGMARYQDVETRPDHRRRGHAKRLLRVAARHTRDRHATKQVVIVADPHHHAITLYRSLGFAEIERQVQLQGRTAPI